MQSESKALTMDHTMIQYRSYKHDYAWPNNNCEIAGIARGQKGMREGMETISFSYANGSKIFGRHRSRERDKNDLIWTWRAVWNSKLVKAVFFLRYVLRCRCLTRYACLCCVVGLHNTL